MINSISFIGAGNVATHFAKAFFEAGITIHSILNRRLSSAKKLASQVDASATTSFKKLNQESDLYIIAVPDDAIGEIATQLSSVIHNGLCVVHTSGATPIQTIRQHFQQAGVIWPPQSLSKEKEIQFNTVPVCYGASSAELNSELKELISLVTPHSQEVDDKQKLSLHLAAVFANNFTNHMYSIAYEICQANDLDFKMLYPIILETAEKVIGLPPHDMQTGPAIRGDQTSMSKHLNLLSADKEYKALYKLVSKSIQQHKKQS